MLVKTKGMGYVEVDENDILQFPHGIYGFEKAHRFVLLFNSKKKSKFMWLQCIDSEEPRFAVIDPYAIFEDYDPIIGEDATCAISLKKKENLRLLVIATVTGNVKDVYFNLKCPIVINAEDNIAMQVILDDERYPMRYYVIKSRED